MLLEMGEMMAANETKSMTKIFLRSDRMQYGGPVAAAAEACTPVTLTVSGRRCGFSAVLSCRSAATLIVVPISSSSFFCLPSSGSVRVQLPGCSAAESPWLPGRPHFSFIPGSPAVV